MSKTIKLSKLEQEALDKVADHTTYVGNYGGSTSITDPKDQVDKRLVKLYERGLILYVGLGTKNSSGFNGGCGLIPTSMFDSNKHTKIDIPSDLKNTPEKVKVSFSLPCVVQADDYHEFEGVKNLLKTVTTMAMTTMNQDVA